MQVCKVFGGQECFKKEAISQYNYNNKKIITTNKTIYQTF